MTEGTLTIRTAQPSDQEAVAELLRAAGLPTDGLGDQFGSGYAVAELAGSVVGAEGIEVYEHAGLLRSAVVASAYRGQRVGDRLTANRLAWARAQGLREVWLLTTTAERWFPRFGFEPALRRDAPAALQASPEFAGACPASAVAMRLTLTT